MGGQYYRMGFTKNDVYVMSWMELAQNIKIQI